MADTKAFFDTNIFIYTFDEEDIFKQQTAQSCIESYVGVSRANISSQVVQEFCSIATRKLADVMTTNQLQDYLSEVLAPLCKHCPTPDFYYRVIRLQERYQISFYDAMIVQAAIDMDCDVIYSEDLQHGQEYNGVEVVNPFLGCVNKFDISPKIPLI